MEINVRKKEWLFLLACLGLAILAEVSFLHGRIGVSYLVFISGFYVVVFLRYRLAFHHRRIGLLFMGAIWTLSGSYLFYHPSLFYHLNILIIPVLVLAHLVLITSPNTFKWNTPRFINALVDKLRDGYTYTLSFCNHAFKGVFKNMNKQTSYVIKRIMIGLLLGIPLVIVIIGLLMSADAVFENVVLRFPQYILNLNIIEWAFRFVFVMLVMFLFFGIFQVLQLRPKHVEPINIVEKKTVDFDSVTALTLLILLNAIYLVFVVIQFKYFFSAGLVTGMTYADYARRGFLELMLVMLINWTLLITFLKCVQAHHPVLKMTIKALNSLLIIMSAVMLASAFQRLSLYESAYGFTLARMLAHAFMLFLMVIFAYTLIRVWIERISLLHFYLIIGLIFYTVLNAVNLEQIIVDKNIERYEVAEKIDIYYLNSLSYTGWDGLIQLYEMNEDIPELRRLLSERQYQVAQQQPASWQSFNFAKQKVAKKLKQLDLEEESQ